MLRRVLKTRSLCLLFALIAMAMPSCAMLPSEIVRDEDYIVAIKSARLPNYMPWYSTFAEHGWFDVRGKDGWTRVEVISQNSGVRIQRIPTPEAHSDERFGGRQVHVLGLYKGESARVMGDALLARAPDFPYADYYSPWPGPNSNTFVDWLSKEVSGLAVVPYPTALGKDYPRNGWIDAGITSTRTGLELELMVLGVQAGLIEGVELHVLGLTLGVGIWPPQLKLPFLPGLPWGLAH